MTRLPRHKTRIICTIGPASQSPATLERMLRQGMDVPRLNLAHGDFESHSATVAAIRTAAVHVGRRVAIMADLPGPKLRVGALPGDALELKRGQLTRLVAVGADERDGEGGPGDGSSALEASVELRQAGTPSIPLSLKALPEKLKRGEDVFLNDGLIQLRVQSVVQDGTALARTVVGGLLRTRDGVSLPGIDLDISAFTERDRDLLRFALGEGVDAVAVSFVQRPDDVVAVREAASGLGAAPFIVAKIERSRAVERIDEILEVTDGLMVARGDLGVEIPIERVGVVQKLLIARANQAGRPVITATQMLESMTENRRPTRAEVTDVANAVLDGTDCVMLSEETAMGAFPVDAVAVMSRVAATTERELPNTRRPAADAHSVREVLAQQAAATAEQLNARYIVVPTETGTTARAIARLRPRTWIVAFSPFAETCQQLQFSRGVFPVYVPEAAHQRRSPLRSGVLAAPVASSEDLPTCEAVDWHQVARRWIATEGLAPGLAVMIQGNNRLEVFQLKPAGDGDVARASRLTGGHAGE